MNKEIVDTQDIPPAKSMFITYEGYAIWAWDFSSNRDIYQHGPFQSLSKAVDKLIEVKQFYKNVVLLPTTEPHIRFHIRFDEEAYSKALELHELSKLIDKYPKEAEGYVTATRIKNF